MFRDLFSLNAAFTQKVKMLINFWDSLKVYFLLLKKIYFSIFHFVKFRVYLQKHDLQLNATSYITTSKLQLIF